MIQITPQMRILVALEAVDGRKGIDSLARLCQERLQTDPFSGWLFVFRSRRGLRGARVTRRQQDLQLMRRQTPRHLARIPAFRPPAKTPFRQPLLGEPKSLAIVNQDANRCSASATEDEQAARERVG